MSSVSADKSQVNVALLEDLNQVQDWHILLEHPCPCLKLHHILLVSFLAFCPTELSPTGMRSLSAQFLQCRQKVLPTFLSTEKITSILLWAWTFTYIVKTWKDLLVLSPMVLSLLSSWTVPEENVITAGLDNGNLVQYVAGWLRLAPIGLYIWLLSYQGLVPFQKNYND